MTVKDQLDEKIIEELNRTWAMMGLEEADLFGLEDQAEDEDDE